MQNKTLIQIARYYSSNYNYDVQSILYAFASKFLEDKDLEKVNEEYLFEYRIYILIEMEVDITMNFIAGPGVAIIVIYIIFLGLSIYCLILFIQLAQRGIKALDIYISKNSNNNEFKQ